MKLSAEEGAILPWLALAAWIALAAWFVWAWMETRGGRDESASPQAEVDHARTEAPGTAHGDPASAVHRLRTDGHARGLVAGGPHQGSDESRCTDVREHGSLAHKVQQLERRQDGSPRRELQTSTSAGHPPLVSRR